MDESKAFALRVAITALFAIYCTPFVLLAISCLSTHEWARRDLILTVFVGFTQSQDQSFAILHRVLLPMMAAFAPLAFRGATTDNWSTTLMVMMIVAIGLSLALDAIFNAQPVKLNLEALNIFPIPGATRPTTNQQPIIQGLASKEQAAIALDAGIAAVNSFFNRTQEAIGMYLLLLFGLKATETTR